MSKIFHGRYTAQFEGPFVVFIVGMRVNRFSAVHKWWPIYRAMRPMLKNLKAHPELGLLSAQSYTTWRTATLIQYWRSFDELERFARDPSHDHLGAWMKFNQTVGADGSVGVWHEAYVVQANQYECIYGNMPRMGLARAGSHVPALGDKETARRRMGMQGDPAVPSYDNPD